MRSRTATIVLISVALITLCVSCAPGPPRGSYIRDGKEYGLVRGTFRNRWWNYYERGVSFSDGKFWAEAESDFKEAVRQRAEDRRRARTYGMHFIDYFPRRELGIVYYFTGQYREALRELETSLSQAPSAKAKYFLNLTRKEILEQTGLDRTPPRIRIITPGEDETTNQFSLLLEGRATDDQFVSSVLLNGEPLFIELSSPEISFRQKIPLQPGMNHVVVEAIDLTGKSARLQRDIRVDREGPLLGLDDVTHVAPGRWRLEGRIFDESGVREIVLGSRRLDGHGNKQLDFRQELQAAGAALPFRVMDMLGNTTSGRIPLEKRGKTRNSRLLYASLGTSDAVPSRKTAPEKGLKPFSQLSALFDRTPPVLELRGLAHEKELYLKSFFIEGRAWDDGRVVAIRVNGRNLPLLPGRNLFFNHIEELQKGENRFRVEAEDAAGNKTAEEIVVIRKVSKVRDVSSRLAVTILPFQQEGEQTPLGATIHQRLAETFVNQGRFNVVARGPELEAALRELKLGASDLADPSNALKVGKLIAAEGFFLGTVVEKPGSIEILARYVNTESSTVMAAEDVYDREVSLSRLQYLIQGLALKFMNRFPLLEGIVIKVKGNQIYANLGKDKHIRKEMKLIVFREGEALVDPVTNERLGVDVEELCQAEVERVAARFSVGKLLYPPEGAVQVMVKDRVITK
ncbi:MAG: hypothetical protein JRI22_13560 [Deltaproteobacteria bacterium]|nr:hypothetical protein [Deltaproteobacteria bacterium]